MGVWPFGWKSSRKFSAGGSNLPPQGAVMNPAGPQRDSGEGNDMAAPAANAKKGGNVIRRQSRQQKTRQLNPEKRTYSFSPGRNDSIKVPKDVHRHHPVPPLPNNATERSGPNTEINAEMSGAQSNTAGQSEGQDWQRVPTLHKRSAQDMSRRKTSKKRKEDHDREAEIKAMSTQIPTRAATPADLSGRPMKKDTKRLRGINKIFPNPASDVSLPLQESLRSSMSSRSDLHTSYLLKGMDLFSPHPTIRYAENPRYVPGASGFGTVKTDSNSRKILDLVPFPKESDNSHKRIDEIADDLDAGGLRELMERDQRRRERKKIADRLKAERKIARKAEKQRAAELEAARNGTPPPKNMDRGVLGREVLGLGIDTGVVASIKRRASDASSRLRGKRPADLDREDSKTSPITPLAEFHRSESLAPSDNTPLDEREDPVIGTALVARLSRASMSQPSSPKGHTREISNISQMIEPSENTDVAPVQPESNRGSSEASSRRQSRSWASFFKRSSKTERTSNPSSFSNLSRDAMAVDMPPVTYIPPRSSASGVPKRTMSKFREDLPELPLSPPVSRVQSPEADLVLPIQSPSPERKVAHRSADSPVGEASLRRHDTPTSGYRSSDLNSRLRNETPTSGRMSNEIPSPEPPHLLSQSLASIDSEASWLSGRTRALSKPGTSHPPLHQPLRDSASSLQKRPKEFSDSTEELGIAEDEYYNRLTPGPEDGYGKHRERRVSGNPMPSSDDEEGSSLASPSKSHNMKWGAVGRHANVVHRDESHAKSREGLFKDYVESDDDSIMQTPVDLEGKGDLDEGEEQSGVQRATSVDYKKAHARHISVGSAKLLDLGESKRLSTG